MSPFHVFVNISLPIFVLIGIGFILDKAFKLDISPLSKVLFYAIIPSLVFTMIVEAELKSSEILLITGISLIHIAVTYLLSYGIFSLKPFKADRPVLACSTAFTNCGNYGIPFMLLAFGARGVEIMAMVVPVQSLAIFSFGLIVLSGESDLKESLRRLIKIPILYALAIGVIVRLLQINIPEVIWVPLEHLNNGMTPVALITLGAQLSQSRIVGKILPTASVSAIRLLLAPLIMFAITLAMDVPRELATMLIVSAGLPTAFNVFLMSKEFGKSHVLASQLVFWTTLLSAITLPLLLILVR